MEIEPGITIFAGLDLYLVIHVDDILISGRNKQVIRDFGNEVGKHSSLKSPGRARDYLGIGIRRDREADTIFLGQQRREEAAEAFLSHCFRDPSPRRVESRVPGRRRVG
jgi:hypothetical protein